MKVRAILTDIEGTTSSIDFVHQVLFPYASRNLPAFVREHQCDDVIATILDDARSEAGEPGASAEQLGDIMLQWIAEDRKVTALKALQGHIWKVILLGDMVVVFLLFYLVEYRTSLTLSQSVQ